jgi:RNA polymerase II subunit A C-terminal domain phosphatase
MSCSHPARVSGMCVICGKVLEEEELRKLDDGEELHDISGVQVTKAEAARIDSESTRRLLEQRKLALIVDLDQTIIHATVDPTVGEWMKDQSNANFNALADVGKFLLGVDGKAVMGEDAAKHANGNSDEALAASIQDGCWYYVKPRPGLQNFLTQLSQRYELHVYTMGTRTYAESVCRLVDPDGSLFGARIISRDENGSLLQKSLSKLFPMDTSMVAIIDDRADVWQWSPNLVRVTPFDFFVGIGDINASFLPSTPNGPTPPPELNSNASTSKVNGSNGTTDQSDDQKAEGKDEEALEAEAKAEDDAAKTVAEESQKTAVSEQLDARPLAKMQEALEGEGSKSSGGKDEEGKPAAVLKETDRELYKLHEVLNDIHARWYADYDKRNSNEEKPSITQIISQIKTAVLDGCTFVFSSIAPVNQDPGSTELWRLATEFGAVCKRSLDSKVTHVIAAKQGTEKVISGHRRNINVVWYTWLQDSCKNWSRQGEEGYALPNPTKEQIRRPPPSSKADVQKTEDSKITEGGGDLLGTTDSILDEEAILTDSDGIDGDKIDDFNDDEEDEDDDGQGFDEMNWDEANDEVDAVLNGLSDDESTINGEGTDSGSSEAGERKQSSKMKRTHSNTSLNGDNSIEEAEEGVSKAGSNTLSPLSKRRRMAELRAGNSKLKQVFDAQPSESRDSSAGPARESSNQQDDQPSKSAQEEEKQEPDEDFLKSLEDELALQLDVDESEQAK